MNSEGLSYGYSDAEDAKFEAVTLEQMKSGTRK
jgi:hypothetical protein